MPADPALTGYSGSWAASASPTVPLSELPRFILRFPDEGHNAVVREFTAWVRAGMPTQEQPG